MISHEARGEQPRPTDIWPEVCPKSRASHSHPRRRGTRTRACALITTERNAHESSLALLRRGESLVIAVVATRRPCPARPHSSPSSRSLPPKPTRTWMSTRIQAASASPYPSPYPARPSATPGYPFPCLSVRAARSQLSASASGFRFPVRASCRGKNHWHEDSKLADRVETHRNRDRTRVRLVGIGGGS